MKRRGITRTAKRWNLCKGSYQPRSRARPKPSRRPSTAVAERTVTHDEHVELKLAKMLLVEEKWFEKQPASKNVPGRPQVFEGVYGERDRFWDPEADTYSVDNNEGSEHGMEIFEEAYEAEDALERYTSAVDLATPEDMRPINVARDYFTNLLLIVFEMMEEEQDFAFAEKRTKRNTRGVQKFTHAGHRSRRRSTIISCESP